MQNKEIEGALIEFKQEIAKPENTLPVIESAVKFVSLWNVQLGISFAYQYESRCKKAR